MKKILIVTNHFYPEVFRVNDVAFDLVTKGHDVTVVTSVPNYPEGKTFPGYGIFKRHRELVNGVDIIRVPVITRGNNRFRLVLNYLTYLFSASVRVLALVVRKRFDCVLVHQTSPVTVGIPAAFASMAQRIPMYFWVLDLWPESLTAAGGVKNKFILGAFAKLTRWLYKKSTKILISSKGFRDSICGKGDFADKLVYFPNWADDDLIMMYGMPHGIELPPMPDGFRIMYAGNIGEAQNFECVMEAAKRLKDTDIKWLLVGDGRKRSWVEESVEKNGLSDNVKLLGRFPIEAMPEFFAQADILLVSLKDEFIFNNTVPAKLQAYMASGKPVLAFINGEGATIVKEASCGFAVPAGDVDALVTTINKKIRHCSDLQTLGANGKNYCNRNFRKDMVLRKLYNLLDNQQ